MNNINNFSRSVLHKNQSLFNNQLNFKQILTNKKQPKRKYILGKKNTNQSYNESAMLISSQNVRSFNLTYLGTQFLQNKSVLPATTSKSRKFGPTTAWMRSWKAKLLDQNLSLIMIQETHVSNQETREALQKEWGRVWGLKLATDYEKLAFFSIGSSQARGVGFLISPYSNLKINNVFFSKEYPDRAIFLQCDMFLFINIYSPNIQSERELFFQSLSSMTIESHTPIIFGGDYNCTQLPIIDRYSNSVKYNSKSESIALDKLISKWDLIDSMFLIQEVPTSPQELEEFREKQMNCFKANSTSRIDRIYISRSRSEWVARQLVSVPIEDTDHKRVSITIRDPKKIKKQARRKILYPFRESYHNTFIKHMKKFLKIQKYLIPYEDLKEMNNFYIATKNIIRDIIIDYRLVSNFRWSA